MEIAAVLRRVVKPAARSERILEIVVKAGVRRDFFAQPQHLVEDVFEFLSFL